LSEYRCLTDGQTDGQTFGQIDRRPDTVRSL